MHAVLGKALPLSPVLLLGALPHTTSLLGEACLSALPSILPSYLPPKRQVGLAAAQEAVSKQAEPTDGPRNLWQMFSLMWDSMHIALGRLYDACIKT